jgi:hypothetical protein
MEVYKYKLTLNTKCVRETFYQTPVAQFLGVIKSRKCPLLASLLPFFFFFFLLSLGYMDSLLELGSAFFCYPSHLQSRFMNLRDWNSQPNICCEGLLISQWNLEYSFNFGHLLMRESRVVITTCNNTEE